MVLTAADALPVRYAVLPPADAARHVFADLDATLAARLEAGDVVVVEELRGAANAGTAFAPLRAAGVVAIVARPYQPGLRDGGVPAGGGTGEPPSAPAPSTHRPRAHSPR